MKLSTTIASIKKLLIACVSCVLAIHSSLAADKSELPLIAVGPAAIDPESDTPLSVNGQTIVLDSLFDVLVKGSLEIFTLLASFRRLPTFLFEMSLLSFCEHKE